MAGVLDSLATGVLLEVLGRLRGAMILGREILDFLADPGELVEREEEEEEPAG